MVFEGKTTNEAIEKGLKELKLARNEVHVKVIENEEKRSFFSILAPRIVKVEIIPIEKKKIPTKELNKQIEEENKISQEDMDKVESSLKSFLEEWISVVNIEGIRL